MAVPATVVLAVAAIALVRVGLEDMQGGDPSELCEALKRLPLEALS